MGPREGVMKRASLLMMLLISLFVFVAPAAAQEKSGSLKIPGIWTRIGIKVQSPIPLPARPPRVDTSTTVDLGGTREEHVAQQGISTEAREGFGGFDNEVIRIPPDLKHRIPNLRGIPIAIQFLYGYSRDLEREVREKIHDKKAVFMETAPGSPCPTTIRPLFCLVVHSPQQYATRSDGGSSSSHGDQHSNYGSSSSNSVMYYVPVTAQLLRGRPKPSLLASTEEKFNVPRNVSEHYAGFGRSYSNNGGSSVDYDLEKVMMSAAAQAAKDALKDLLEEKDRWRASAQILVREAFNK